jgi:RimJ/RimL family protein N-acetyltransferase
METEGTAAGIKVMLQPTPITLTGRYVRLEPLGLDHIDALWLAGNHPELWRYYSSPMLCRDDMQRYVEVALQQQSEGKALPLVQVHSATGEVVGSTRYGNIDVPNDKLEIGWTWLTPSYQRTGINTEAKFLLLAHAFEALGCIRVELKADATNLKSRAAMERIGATFEGTLRRHMRRGDGTQRDTVYYSVISDEWPEVKSGLRSLLAAHAP